MVRKTNRILERLQEILAVEEYKTRHVWQQRSSIVCALVTSVDLTNFNTFTTMSFSIATAQKLKTVRISPIASANTKHSLF